MQNRKYPCGYSPRTTACKCYIGLLQITNYLLLLPDDTNSAESLLLLLELPEDSLPRDSFPWDSLPWDSLPWDSVPLPLDPLLFISTSSWREWVIFRLLWPEAGRSWLLSLPSDARPSSVPSAKLAIQ